MCLIESEGLLITGGENAILRQWDYKTRDLVHEYQLNSHTKAICLIALHEHSESFFTVCKGGIVKRWSYKQQSMWENLQAVNEEIIYDIGIANEGKYLFTVGRLGIIKQLS